MSTRSVLEVYDTSVNHQKSVQLYRHCDGYPEGEHGVIETVRKLWKFINKGRFLCHFGKVVMTLGYIGTSNTNKLLGRQGKLYRYQMFELEDFGTKHGDLEWIYKLHIRSSSILLICYKVHGTSCLWYRTSIYKCILFKAGGKEEILQSCGEDS